MFRRIVSYATYSPSLMIEIAKYSDKLRSEYKKRLAAFILLFIALSVQLSSLLLIQPSTETPTQNDMIYGGIDSKSSTIPNNFIAAYSSNRDPIQNVLSYIGISLSEVERSSVGTYDVTGLYAWSKTPYNDQNELTLHSINTNNSPQIFLYTNKLNALLQIDGLSGQSENAGRFVIQSSTGNIFTEKIPQIAQQSSSIETSTTISNITHPNSTAQAGDRLKINLQVTNKDTKPVTYDIINSTRDLNEYADLASDYGGGYYDKSNQSIIWSDINIQPKNTISRSYIATIKVPIPTNSTSKNNDFSYDCYITNIFGSKSSIQVDCPVAKTVESVLITVPPVSRLYSIYFLAILTIICAFMFTTTALLIKELRIIRQIITQGTI